MWLLILTLMPWVSVSAPDDGRTWAPPRVTIQAAPLPEPVVLVTIGNDEPACGTLFITGTYFASPANRPMTLLSFDVTDPSGRPVSRKSGPHATRPNYTLADLVLLHCGASYTLRIALDRFDWGYELPPGKYRVRAQVENRVHSFFASHRAERQHFLDAFRLDSEFGMELLLDFSVSSNELELEVHGANGAHR